MPAKRYTERHAAATGVRFEPGWRLMEWFLNFNHHTEKST
jgi:hypothetical protein